MFIVFNLSVIFTVDLLHSLYWAAYQLLHAHKLSFMDVPYFVVVG